MVFNMLLPISRLYGRAIRDKNYGEETKATGE